MLEGRELMVFYENMLALNNVSLECGQGQIIGVFGSNSAGKSTLMYALSGIILDIKKKEEMRGGERISLFGNILVDGEDITNVKPHLRAKMGIILCPERRRIFPESSVLEKSEDRVLSIDEARGQGEYRVRARPFPQVEGPPQKAGRFPQRGRTTDACHRQGAHGQAEDTAPR